MPVSPAFRDSHLVMSLHWLVSSFFALSFLFQAAAAVADARRVGFGKKNSGKNDDDVSASFLAGGASEERRAKSADDHVTTTHRAAMASWLRFVEYSFSAAVMVVAIALQVGLMDAWMLFALAALTWTTMMLGLVGERVLAAEERVVAAGARAERSSRLDRDRDDESETNNTHSTEARDDPRLAMRSETAAVAAALRVVRWTAHLTGWVSQGVVFVVIIAHFFASQRACEWEDSTEEGNRREDNVAPDFVYAIVFAELALFVGFGSTQFAQFAQFDRDVYAKCAKSKRAKCAKRRERRRGSEKKETTTKSENEDETDAAPAGTTAPRAPARWRVLRRRTSCNRS